MNKLGMKDANLNFISMYFFYRKDGLSFLKEKPVLIACDFCKIAPKKDIEVTYCKNELQPIKTEPH